MTIANETMERMQDVLLRRLESNEENCSSKKRYETRMAAQSAMQRLLKNHRGEMFNPDTLCVYQCMSCLGYHMGNSLYNRPWV